MTIILIYWLVTTIYGTYWLVKNPSARLGEDNQYVTLLEILGKAFLASVLAWVIAPMMLLATIKFKR
jgi:hypothetical protein